jgi:hypothetical protein
VVCQDVPQGAEESQPRIAKEKAMITQCPVTGCDGGKNCPWHVYTWNPKKENTMTSVNASDEGGMLGMLVEPLPTAYEIFKKDAVRKPLTFDVEDAGCQANGPAMFGGTDTNPAYTMEHAWLQIQNQIKMAHDTGYAKGFQAGAKAVEKAVHDFIHFMTNPKRATEKPRGQM